MMLASAQPFPQRPALPRGFRYADGAFDQEVIADSTGRIVAGDPGQASVDEWLTSKNLLSNLNLPPLSYNLVPNYAAFAALAVVAFFLIRGQSK